MDDSGLLAVVSALAGPMDARQAAFSAHLRKRVRKLADELRTRTAGSP
jgi:hypothetical protein